jgi:GH24 family phage-related lysozyme (muramidase)
VEPEEISQALLNLQHFEGRTTYLYRDSAEAGNATIGIGCLIPSEQSACLLPFQVATGAPATADQIRAEYQRVMKIPPARLARTYRQQDASKAIELPDQEVTVLATTRLRLALAGLRKLIPGFDDLPEGVRAGLLDLAWCLGLGKLATWHHLLAAVARRDWPTAAFESHVAGGRNDRNAWRFDQIANAVRVA